MFALPVSAGATPFVKSFVKRGSLRGNIALPSNATALAIMSGCGHTNLGARSHPKGESSLCKSGLPAKGDVLRYSGTGLGLGISVLGGKGHNGNVNKGEADRAEARLGRGTGEEEVWAARVCCK